MKKESAILAVVILLVVGFFVFSRVKLTKQSPQAAPLQATAGEVGGQPLPEPQPSPATQPSLLLPPTDNSLPTLGYPLAPVKVIEFGDYQCPFCRKLFVETETKLREEFIGKGLVSFAWKDFAFLGPESFWAAMAARCANEQNQFWAYHDLLFYRQGGENVGVFSKDNLKKFASQLKLDNQKFDQCLDSEKYKDLVQKDTVEGQKLGVRGTPFLLINDKRVEGAYPYEAIKAMIETELKQ